MSQETVIIATLCFIFDETGDCLMLKRRRPPHQNQWNAPGGKLKIGESPLECCLREVKEETGLSPTDIIDMGSIYCTNFQGCDNWQLRIFTGRHPRVPVPANPEGVFSWLGTEKILCGGDKVVHNIPLFLPLLMRAVPFKGLFEYDGNYLIRYSLDLIDGSCGLKVDS